MAGKYLKKINDEFTLEDVGSTLLEDLAKGLYQPEEVIREYVQNAIDAHRLWNSDTGIDPEGPIQIEIRGDKLSILDYGIGMDQSEIIKVKSIAVSRKPDSAVDLTGHKGVGIWAGLSFFERVELYSTKRGKNRGYKLTILFKKIVDSIKEDTHIGGVLNPNYFIEEFEEEESNHYTNVTLVNPLRAEDYFLEEDKVRGAIRRNCPCELDPTFVLSKEVNDWYIKYRINTYPIKINGEVIYRSYPSVVNDFQVGVLTINDEEIAVYWQALHKNNRVIPYKEDQLVGFRIIQSGFVLGGENQYSQSMANYEGLSLASYLNWYIGEIHIVSKQLRPNLRRNEFEESEPTRQLITSLRKWYQDLSNETRVISEVRNIKEEYRKYHELVKSLSNKGAPLLISEEETDDLVKIQKRLQQEEIKVEDNKGKRNPQYKIKALRLISSDRKKLLGEVGKILASRSTEAKKRKPVSNSVVTITAGGVSREDKERAGITNPAQEKLIDLETIPVETEVEIESIETDPIDSRQRHFHLDVVLGLFEEILFREISDGTKVKVIMEEIKNNLRLVSQND